MTPAAEELLAPAAPAGWRVTGTQPVLVGGRELAPGDEFDQEPPAFLIQIGAVAPKE